MKSFVKNCKICEMKKITNKINIYRIEKKQQLRRAILMFCDACKRYPVDRVLAEIYFENLVISIASFVFKFSLDFGIDI